MLFGREARLTVVSVLIALGCLFGPAEASAGMCESNNPDEIPPFITRGVDPNLLMIIDNSASMYDLAYIADAGLCYDDSYSGTTSYAGYFAEDTWYAYEGNQFVVKTEDEANAMCTGATYRKSVEEANHICLTISEAGAFDSFVAKGNFLNWTAASKLDIEKKILTGGKHDSTAGDLVMESRGCLERRFIRKTDFDSEFDSKLTLAVRPPTDTELSDAAGTATRIELFPVTAAGYDHAACQLAVDEMRSGSPSLGELKGYIDDCMGYPSTGGNDPATAARSAFNHSVQNCWYLAKQGEWAPGEGSVTRVKNDCEKVYEELYPWEIDPDHSGYVCFGDHRRSEEEPLVVRGYVGRCWDTGEGTEDLVCTPRECDDEPYNSGNPRCIDGVVHQCDGNYNVNQDQCLGSPGEWVAMEDCTGGGGSGNPGWLSDDCVDAGLRDYCGTLNFPEVVDPSDQVTGSGDATDDFWNLPAMLVDSGVSEQLGSPLVVMAARIDQPEAPSGLIQEFATDLRIGAMVFNWDGAYSECSQDDPYVSYQCNDPDILDGGRVIASIGKGDEHTQALVDAVNDIVADTWTPLSETIYNAVGYFAQDEGLRLHTDDFTIYGGNEPITDWCQLNNILLITDGAPTADRNQQMIDFAESLDYTLGSTCPALHGSTYLRDLTQYAYEDIWWDRTFPEGEEWQTVTTHVVAVGDFRDEGADLCSPDMLLQETAASGGTELYKAETLDQLETALREAFGKIRAGAAAGSAASVISATRSGEGAVYQAIFWPEKSDSAGRTIQWAGEVQALFVDDRGRFFEDTNGNRRLDADDLQVTIFFDPVLNYSRACYGVIQGGVCTGEVKDIAEVNYLWAANDWLSGLGDNDVLYNRASTQFTSDLDKRHIFTWYDSNNDGVVDDQEVLPFEKEFIAGLEEDAYNSLGVSGETEVENIVEWLRGRDQEGLRSREIDIKGNVGTWRLGDIVHSTPTAVSRPAEGYQFLYLDNSYARFASRYNNRRHMIYFGGNDGMLHAVNGGFFNIGEKKFCKTSDCQDEDQGLPLGAEVWSYVPYNLWPHLKCLADPEYGHKYYVDQVPRIFDVQIFEEEPICSTDLHNPGCTYPGGWGTILVGGMRFGGEETTVNGRTFTSAYFILDITNPEQPPRLLGEMTFTGSEDEADMGFTTSVPTMVPMVNRQDGTSEWYLVLGSGPTDLKGVSDQPGRVGVISLRELVNTTPGDPFRIPADPPEADGKQIGSFALTGHENSFVSDLITVDFNFDYLADSVYFGTVAGDFNLSEGGWDGGGKVYRLVTEKLDSSGKQVPSEPHEWATLLESHVDGLSNPLPLIDVGEPVTAAPAAAWDGSNYWIYFGTGRLFNREDLKDQDSYSYFGIKEPVDCETGRFTWETVDFTVLDKDSFDILSTTPGERGLLRVDEIEVLGGENASTADLICTDGTYDCLPSQVSTFAQLRSYIAGYDCESGTDGWYRKFHDTGERNLGQATVLGGLLTFSTYLPSQDPCSPEGFSDLYAFYYQTGTPWYRSVFTSFTVEEDVGEPVEYRQRIGPGLAVTPSLHVGADRGAKAFLQTSTGAIIGVEQPELPLSDYKTGRESWREIYRNILVIDETGEVQ